MKFLEKININSESKTYITGAIFFVITLFLLTAVVFLVLISDKLDIVMTQPAGETYTYFIAIMDRILAVLSVCMMIPLTIYQIASKQKSKIDHTVSYIAGCLLVVIAAAFIGGEVYYFKKYNAGELSYSKMFCKPTVETKIFDSILQKQNKHSPKMCQPRHKNKN